MKSRDLASEGQGYPKDLLHNVDVHCTLTSKYNSMKLATMGRLL